MIYPVAIVGGGASGLLAACLIAGASAPVLLLEGEDRVGKKLLATGNGRCNLSNLNIAPAFYHGPEGIPEDYFTRFSCERIRKTFLSLGLLTRIDGEGRVYPYSLQASSVLDILRLHCERAGVETRCGDPVVSAERRKGLFRLCSRKGSVFWAEKVILACGSPAGMHLGCPMGGYELARHLGHSVSPVLPVLVPVRVNPDQVRSLKGLRCRAKISLMGENSVLREEMGEVQFTENALSGICILNVSGQAEKGMRIVLDLMPEYSQDQIETMLKNAPRIGLEGFLNKRIAREVLRQAEGNTPDRLAKSVKSLSFTVVGKEGLQRAQACAGGVPLEEISLSSMASRICPGLYMMGEMLNIYGDCGGYNLHFAWSSAIAAAENICRLGAIRP